jgi:hypothetical protein
LLEFFAEAEINMVASEVTFAEIGVVQVVLGCAGVTLQASYMVPMK